MSHASCQFIVGLTAAALLLGMLLGAAPVAAQQGWAPVVSKESKLERAQNRNVRPHEVSKIERALAGIPLQMAAPKPAAPAANAPVVITPLPAVSKAQPAPSPAAVTEITTGSIGASGSTQMLSPTDAARLFAEKDDAGTSELTTGAVDGQGSDLSRGYCANIAVAATDARIALQKMKLAEVEREITKRIATLEAKTAEYKAWVERRDEFLKRATNSLVKIYAQMEPDAAAQQLVSMDEETAASLLMKADPQNASAILNEMPPDKAARLTATIAGAARVAERAAAARPQAPQPNPGEAR